jgi:hypothetical protein
MKISRELVRRRVAGKSGVALTLGVGQVACRHIVRNLGHLRGAESARANKGLSLAKDVRETAVFCNIFRTGCEAAA